MIIDIKQYLKETNSVLLTEQAYKYLTEKASVIEKLEEIKTEMDIIEELEKIRAEIEELAYLFDDLSPDKELVVDLDNIEEVFNKHISELKGE